MNRACEGCGDEMHQRYLTGGLCLACEWKLELPPEVRIHRVHHKQHCAACGHPSWGDLCARCDDFVST